MGCFALRDDQRGCASRLSLSPRCGWLGKGEGWAAMKASDVPRAVTAAVWAAAALSLRVDVVVVLHDSNKLTVRLQPCDVLARVAPAAELGGVS